jgi:SNF2 family DNA or RNA helicase
MMPKVYSAKWRWIEQHYEVSNGWGGSRQVGSLKNERALYHELNRVMLRRTKAEVAPDMPAKTYVGTPLPSWETVPDAAGTIETPSSNVADRELVGVWLPMDGEQRKLYDQINGQGHAKMEGGDLNPIGILAELTRLKQFATASGRLGPDSEFIPKLPSNKFDYLLAQLEEWGFPEDPTEKVVVVSQFTSVLALFQTALRTKMDKDWTKRRGGSDMACELSGRVTGARREETINRFNMEVGTDSPHVMFLNVKAGGVAITLDSADHMIILDETWVPDDMEQVEDRIHRVSRPRPVFYHYLRSLGTVEEHIAATNLELAMTNHEVLDGRRGLEFSRRVASKL